VNIAMERKMVKGNILGRMVAIILVTGLITKFVDMYFL